MDIKLDKRLPVYEQIIEYFKKSVVAGIVQLGQEIPSRREFAMMWGINPNTVQRAYKEMTELGLIYTEGNTLSRITENQQLVDSIKKQMVKQAVQQLIDELTPLGYTTDDMIRFIKEQHD